MLQTLAMLLSPRLVDESTTGLAPRYADGVDGGVAAAAGTLLRVLEQNRLSVPDTSAPELMLV